MASCARITAKVLIVVVAAICSILGFIVVVGTIVARASIFMDYAQVSNALFWLALVIGLSMLLGATAGIYGAFKPDQCLVGLFVVMVGILSTMFIALTVAIFFIHDKYHHAFSSINCTDPDSIVRDLIKQYREASGTLCTRRCPCDYQYYNASSAPSSFVYSRSGAVKMQQCASFQHQKGYFAAYFLEAVEHDNACQGVCEDPTPAGFPRLFYFSNVNSKHGKPDSKRCDPYLVDYIQEEIGSLQITMLGVTVTAVICFLIILVIWCLDHDSKHFKKKKERSQEEEDPLLS